jgi:potassium/hydrogen antiporter
VAFLGLGMLLGSEGPGGIAFDDADLARVVGTVGLVAILFEGGLTTRWRALRPVIVPAATLSSLGVAVTAAVTGAAAYALFDLRPAEAFLLGAVVGSTDAAAVFATLRFTTLRRRLARLLEAESGANDPMAVALTLGMIAWITEPAYGAADLTLLLVRQLGLGLAIGIGLGYLAARLLVPLSGLLAPFAPVASVGIAALSFGVAETAGASGFLAVYVVGLWIGNAPSPLLRSLVAFHTGLAFLAQVALFVVLGLLVFPSDVLPVAVPALALTAALVFVARPVAVLVCTAFQGFGPREHVLLGWGGLRGAVPIVLATFALSAELAASDTIFNAVFFVVVASALVQGPTLEPLAGRLGVTTDRHPLYEPPIEVAAVQSLGADLLEFTVRPGDAVVGKPLRELHLPADALVAVIVRQTQAVPPRGSTIVAAGDQLYVLALPPSRKRVERLFESWRSEGEAND